MNAVELHLPDGKPCRIWVCGKCRRLHSAEGQPVGDGKGRTYTPEERDEFGRAAAVKCCDYRCEVCNEKCREFYALCDKHGAEKWAAEEREQDARRFEKAKKVTVAEWDGVGMLYDGLADRWHSDLEAAEEHYADDPGRTRPAHLWLSVPVTWSPDASGTFADQMGDHFHEDAVDGIPDAAWKELDRLVDGWWEANRLTSWEPDYKRCLILNPVARPDASGAA